MFELIHSGGPYSDETSSYKVKLNGEYTVKSFIQEVLSKKEWGYIGIDDGNTIFGNPRIEYHSNVALQDMTEEYLRLKVISVRASGGWSRMDYLITPEVVNGEYVKVTEHYGILPENIYGKTTYNVYRNNNVSPEYVISTFRKEFSAINDCKYMERMLNIKE